MENSCESLYNTENACDIIDTEKNANKNCIQGMDIIMFKKKKKLGIIKAQKKRH